MTSIRAFPILAAALAFGGAAPALAQLPNPSAASVGMAGNYSVMTRGFSAVYWNPAGLAMPGSPGFSISLLPVGGVAGLDPITLGDIAEYDDGTLIPDSVRRDWMDLIDEEGSQQGSGALGFTWLALNVGRFGFQAGTSSSARADLSPGIARLLLFGNADGDSAATIEASGSEMTMAAVTTAALSYAHPLSISLGPLPDQHFALGVTVKYVIGNALLSGENVEARAEADPVEVAIRFPMIASFHPDSAATFGDFVNEGSGFGIDIGAMWQAGIFSAAVSLQNLINTFAWNEDELWYIPGEVHFDGDTLTADTADFSARPFAEAPDALRDRLSDLAYPPMVSVGGAVRLPMVTVTGEVRHLAGESVSLEGRTHLGVGAEFRPVRFLPIRAGVATVSGGYTLGAGLGLEFGVFNLNLGGNLRSSDLGTDYTGALTVSFGG